MKIPSQLVDRCRKGEYFAQKEVFALLGGKVKAICYRYCGDYHISEDLMQEVFISVFEKLNQYQGEGSFEGWVRRIAVNTSLLWIRKQKHLLSFQSESDYHNVPEENYEEDWIDIYSGQKLMEYIADLPTGYRLVVNLHAIEGYSHKEIAEKLGITETTSRTQYHRSKNLLKTKILAGMQHFKV